MTSSGNYDATIKKGLKMHEQNKECISKMENTTAINSETYVKNLTPQVWRHTFNGKVFV
jgi:hypothetical protein